MDMTTFSMLQGEGAMLAQAGLGDETSAVRFITPNPCVVYDWQPSISPDGRRVIFSTFTPSEPETLAIMDITTTTAKCTLLFPGKLAQWAPRGDRWVFARTVSGNDQIFTFDEGTNQLTQITFLAPLPRCDGVKKDNDPYHNFDADRTGHRGSHGCDRSDRTVILVRRRSGRSVRRFCGRR